jgi:peptidoglycan/LPS O-acetylase OafA/YrhL
MKSFHTRPRPALSSGAAPTRRRPGPSISRARLPGLDGLRALAVLAVLIFHADSRLLPGGFLGVDLFFVLSGYLITRLLLSELGHTGRLDLAGFYLRRVFRLMPALIVLLLAVTAAVAWMWHDELPTLKGSVVSSLAYVGNWWLIDAHQSYFVASGRPPMLQHLWSLAIEEQFYLLWPVVLMAITARRRRFGWVAALALGLALASTCAMALIAVRTGVPYAADSSRVYFGTDTHAMGLLLGAAVGALAERLDFQPKRSWRIRPWATDVVGLAGLLTFGWLSWRLDEFSEALFRGGFFLISGLAVLVVASVARPTSHLGRLLSRQPLRWLGDRSYAIYLWHWPVVVVTRPGVDLPADRWAVDGLRLVLPLALASLSHLLVETPLRRAGLRWLEHRRDPQQRPVSRVVPRRVGIAAVAAVVVSAVAMPTVGSGLPVLASAAQTLRAPVASASSHHGTAAKPVQFLQTVAPVGLASPGNAGAKPAAAPGGQPLGGAVSKNQIGPAAGPPLELARRRPPQPAQQPVPRTASGRPSAAAITAVEPSITAFGDSVMLGAQPALDAKFPHSAVYAVEGRQPYVTLKQVRELQAAKALSPVVAIHTGNNGIIRASDLSDTLGALRDRRQVVLFTDRVPMDWQQPNNSTITQVAKRFGNVVVLDWYARSNSNQSWFYDDGLHLRPPGAIHYADLLAQALAR